MGVRRALCASQGVSVVPDLERGAAVAWLAGGTRGLSGRRFLSLAAARTLYSYQGASLDLAGAGPRTGPVRSTRAEASKSSKKAYCF